MPVFITHKECNVPLVFLWLDSEVVVILSAEDPSSSTADFYLPFLVFQFWQAFPKLLVNKPAWCPGSCDSRETRTAWRKPQSQKLGNLLKSWNSGNALNHWATSPAQQSDSLVPGSSSVLPQRLVLKCLPCSWVSGGIKRLRCHTTHIVKLSSITSQLSEFWW